LGMPSGDYSLYGSKVESLFLPSELPAFEEYGIPVQVSLKIQDRLLLNEGLDQAITSLKSLNLAQSSLSAFERAMIEDARSAM
jgi:hypothetical protein